ncbi:MAG: putative hydrolase superfamily [Deltaproteobacteria bacterium]|nr:putative hydrolase superfamily [Deltaproteobacteria bacterium]
MYRTILWDNDGILVRSEDLYYEATREIMRKVKVELNIETYRQYFLRENGGAWHLVRAQGHDPLFVEKLRAARNELYGRLLQTRDIAMDGAGEVLRQLAGRFRMGIVTSSKREHFEIIHRRTGFLPYFDFVVGEGDYRRSKPDPEPYQIALERCGSRVDECLAIEDSERGLRAAKGAGLDCWVIPTPLTVGSDFARADRLVKDIRQIPQLLLNPEKEIRPQI